VSTHSATRRRSTGRGKRHRLVGVRRFRLEVEPVLCRIACDDDGRENHRHVVASLTGYCSRFAASAQKSSTRDALMARLEPAPDRRCTTRGRGPVAVEQPGERTEVFGSGERGLLWIRALVDVPVLPQAVLEAGAPAMNARPPWPWCVKGRSVLNALSTERHVSQIQRESFGAEDSLESSAGICCPASCPSSRKSCSRPWNSSMNAMHALVQGNRNVVLTGLQVRLDRVVQLRRGGCGARVADIARSSSIEAGSYFFSVNPSPSASAFTS